MTAIDAMTRNAFADMSIDDLREERDYYQRQASESVGQARAMAAEDAALYAALVADREAA